MIGTIRLPYILLTLIAAILPALAGAALAADSAVSAASAVKAETAASASQSGEIEALVRDLGAPNFQTRERASAALAKIGRPALAALEKAAVSDDPEVNLRAKRVLDNVRLGIAPDWPPEVALQVRHFHDLPEDERPQAVQHIVAALGQRAGPFLVEYLKDDKLSENERSEMVNHFLRWDNKDLWLQAVELIGEPQSAGQKRVLAAALTHTGSAIAGLAVLKDGHDPAADFDETLESAVKALGRLFADGNYKDTYSAAARCTASASNDARLLYFEALAANELGRKDESEKLRRQAFGLNPENKKSHFEAGQILFNIGFFQQAAAEWEKVLALGNPDDNSTINAYFHLGQLYANCSLFARAAESIEKGLKLFDEANDGHHAIFITGATEGQLRKEIVAFRARARRFPAPAGADVVDAPLKPILDARLHVTVRDDQGRTPKKILQAVQGRIAIQNLSKNLKNFDATGEAVKYDSVKQEITIQLPDTPLGKPAKLPLKFGLDDTTVEIDLANVCYIFKIDPVTGAGKRLAAYSINFDLEFFNSDPKRPIRDGSIKLNGKKYTWAEAVEGIKLDAVPVFLVLEAELKDAAGQPLAARLNLLIDEWMQKQAAPDSPASPAPAPNSATAPAPASPEKSKPTPAKPPGRFLPAPDFARLVGESNLTS